MPATTETPSALKSRTRHQMIEAGGRLCQLLGLPRSTGQIYGLLYLATDPLTLDHIVEILSISKGSASTGTRQLVSWGAIRQVWVPGERQNYFEVVPDLTHLIRASYSDFLKPRLNSTTKRLEVLSDSLETEFKSGIFTGLEYKVCAERLKTLAKLQKRISALAPLAEKLL